MGEEQSIDELEDGGLARTARAHQRDDLTGLDRQREIVENGRLPSVPERHLAEVDAVHVMTIVVSAFRHGLRLSANRRISPQPFAHEPCLQRT